VRCNYQVVVQGVVNREFVGLGYDFMAPMMNEKQRASVRTALTLSTRGMWSIGMDAVRSPSTDTSNWVPTHMMHLMTNALAIEGESGYDPELFPRLEAGFERFFVTGLTIDGTTFEGMGKDCIQGNVLLMLARRGSLLPALANVVAHARDFYFAVSSPLGSTYLGTPGRLTSSAGSFTWDEMLGGVQERSRYADVAVLKHLYPTEPLIDFVFRTEMANLTALSDFNIRFPYSGMVFLYRAVSARDWKDAQGDSTWAQAQAALAEVPTANLTHFFNIRGLLVARTDWSVTATQLLFQSRCVLGGHDQLDRTKFGLAAKGRWWLPYRSVDQPSISANVVYVDGHGPSAIPAAMRALYTVGDGIGTFATSDATITYSRRFEGESEADHVFEPAT